MLLLLHGVHGHGARWRRLAESRLTDFRVLAPDLRGHGQSPKEPPWTLEQHAADLLAVIESQSADRVTVVGHSFGGVVAVHLALLAPQRVSGLVLLDPAIHVPASDALKNAEGAWRSFATREEAAAEQRGSWPDVADEVIEDELDANLVRDGDAWRPRYSPAAMAGAWSEMCRAPALPPQGVRTLLVPALREEFVPPEYVRACRYALGDDFEAAGLNCGHMQYLERPDDVAELIVSFAGG
ncbi:lipase [Herbihabitans rhizosphaerae]|uniref:Lipase n=1 Tax=Herbihabitans rhizosphaerae TaxID=1872711 RepID=A0A4Q7L6I2_9PSEU|nr:lipase [Herbihabitans rhizosphaerae]